MAECGHVACRSCWTKWLNKSKTCPVCRRPVTTQSLSRVVFEQTAGRGVPTLSQMYTQGNEEDDDEDPGGDGFPDKDDNGNDSNDDDDELELI